MQEIPVISQAPSFNSYSNGGLAEIAARVVKEFDSDEEFYVERRENSAAERAEEGRILDYHAPKSDADGEEGEFEFASVTNFELSSPISADEIFQNGKIRPVYPVFKRDLLLEHVKFENENEKENVVRNSISSKGSKIRLPLRKLFIEERETAMTMSSSSSSEADELDGVPAEMYCVWRPKEAAEAEEDRQCKKSGSAGCYSKRWKFKDFLSRSNSDASRGSSAFLPHSSRGNKNENNQKLVEETPAGGRKAKSAATPSPQCNRDGGEKQRFCLPHRQEFGGVFR